MGSAGADKTATLCRGDSVLDLPEGYRFMLPSLPVSDSSKSTVFLHADIGARPYRIEDFKEPLRELGVLQEVTGMGVFQMGHVWTVRLKSSAAKEMLMRPGKFQVKGGWCVPIDPDRREVRVKLHWVQFDTPNDALKKALEDFGAVRDITREKWHVDGFDGVESTTRVVRLQLREGTTVERLPHQLRVHGGTVLVVVPGRAPLCLRCRRSGHIRRDCRAPRCSECRAYGHESQDCIRTYARAASGRGAEDETNELLMDEEEAEQAAAPSKPASSTKEVVSTALRAAAAGPRKDGDKAASSGPAADGKLTAEPPAASTTGAKTPVAKGDCEPVSGAEVSLTEVAEKPVRSKNTDTARDTDVSGDIPWEAADAKRRPERVGATAGEMALRRLERQWTFVGKKGRYEVRSRSPSRTREDSLSQ